MQSKFLKMLTLTTCAFGMMCGVKAASMECNGSEVAKVDDACYATLKDAVTDAAAGKTIVLQKSSDISESYIHFNKNIDVDFNGFTVTLKAPSQMGLLIYGSTTLKNGKLINEVDNTGSTAITLASAGKVKLEGMEISATKGSGVNMYQNNTELTVDKDTVITAYDNAAIVAFSGSNGNTASHHKLTVDGKVYNKGTTGRYAAINGSYYSNTTLDVTIGENAVVSSDKGTGLLQMANGDVVINGQVSGYEGAVAITRGNLTVNEGATLSATGVGEKTEYEPSAAGKLYANGAAIYAEPVGALKITINGGDITSKQGYAISAPANNNKNNNLTMEITDGNFEGSKGSIEFNEITDEQSKFIKGGTFADDIDTKFLAETMTQSVSGKVGKVYKITKENTVSGTFTVNEDAVVGEVVTLTISPSDGYEVEKIMVKTADGMEIPVSENNTFEMPESDVTVSVIFKTITVQNNDTVIETNPDTFDNVVTYGTIIVISLGAIAIAIKKTLKI